MGCYPCLVLWRFQTFMAWGGVRSWVSGGLICCEQARGWLRPVRGKVDLGSGLTMVQLEEQGLDEVIVEF